MERTSLEYQAREERAYRTRVNAALETWEKEHPGEGNMSCDWKELFECRSLSSEELIDAKLWKIELLRRRISTAQEKLHADSSALYALLETCE